MAPLTRPPVIFPTASLVLPSKQYILSLTPHSTSTSSHLILRHPSASLTVIDSETLQVAGQLSNGHTRDISAVTTGSMSGGGGGASAGAASGGEAPGKGDIWSAGKDAIVVRWDERSRTTGQKIKASTAQGKALPLLSLALPQSGSDTLLVAGSELVSSEAWLLFWDTRNPSKPLYAHSSTHSDDITFLSFLPPTSSYLSPASSGSGSNATSGPTPSPLLLSGSTDGLLALTNPKEEDEEEAFWGAEGGLGGSVAAGGAYLAKPVKAKGKGKQPTTSTSLRVWGRSDQDSLATFSLGRPTEPDPESPGDIEFQNSSIFSTSTFKPITHSLTPTGKVKRSIRDETLGAAEQEGSAGKGNKSVEVDYLIDVSPSLGVNGRSGQAIVGAGSNNGDIVLLHHHTRAEAPLGIYEPSAFLMSGSSGGHRDVVRCMYHDVRANVLYTGSEDGVLSGWNLPDPSDFLTGDTEHDDDGGDGREIVGSGSEDEESASDEDEMDVDESDEDEDEEVVWAKATSGKRPGSEVWGGGGESGRKRRG